MATQRDRSPSYPIIPLGVALKRLAAFDSHFKRSPARAEKVGEAWEIKAKAYAYRTAAALRYYGLIDYENVENVRQIVISEEGRTYLRAQQKHIKQEIIKKAALRPAQIGKFWSLWGADRPADDVCIDDLAFKNSFSDRGARKFLKVYDSTITFAGLTESDKILTVDDAEHEEDDDLNHQRVTPKVGNYVQWTSGGSDQFPTPRCVTWISDDGNHARVHGSLTGIKMNELTVVDPPAPPPARLAGKKGITPSEDENDINVLLTGKRLQITADVNEAGIERLKQMLTKYEEILKLLSQPVHGVMATEYTDDGEGREAEERDEEIDGDE